MNIGCFIDYDNIEGSTKLQGIQSIVTKIFEHIKNNITDNSNRLNVRFYGGWYDENGNLTHDAQKISSEISQYFPLILNFKINESICKIICQAELAYSLMEIPGDVLHATFRKKSINNSLRCLKASDIQCNEPNCLADHFYQTNKTKKCSQINCQKPINDFLFRNEQKMIDTMLTCDIIYTANNEIYDLTTIVSSDDDFVPLLKTLLNKKNKLIHIETKKSSNNMALKFNLKVNSIIL